MVENNAAQTEPLNMEHVMETVEGDMEFARELLELYVTDTEERLEMLERAIAGQDADTVRREGHTIKGASANIGADLLREVALKMENIGDTGDFTEAVETLESMKAEFERVRLHMEQFLSTNT